MGIFLLTARLIWMSGVHSSKKEGNISPYSPFHLLPRLFKLCTEIPVPQNCNPCKRIAIRGFPDSNKRSFVSSSYIYFFLFTCSFFITRLSISRKIMRYNAQNTVFIIFHTFVFNLEH